MELSNVGSKARANCLTFSKNGDVFSFFCVVPGGNADATEGEPVAEACNIDAEAERWIDLTN